LFGDFDSLRVLGWHLPLNNEEMSNSITIKRIESAHRDATLEEALTLVISQLLDVSS